MVFQRSMLNWRRGWSQSAIGICALGYIYMKLIWCNGFPEIYAQLEGEWGQSAMGICALCYIWNLFGVMVVQRSMLNWRRGWGQSAIGISALCYIYMKLIWCNGFPKIYVQLEEGRGSIWHWYICIVLYMKCIWCNGFLEIHAQLEEGVGSVCHRYMCIGLYIYETYLV